MQVAEMFPEAESTIKRLIREDKKKLQYCRELEKKHVRFIHDMNMRSKEGFMRAYLDEIDGLTCMRRKAYARKNRLERILKCMDICKRPHRSFTIQQAKEIPITDFLTFNHAGFRTCVFHEEKTPSMKFYQKDNHVYCFGCHKPGDTVNVVQALYGFNSISEALQFLKKTYSS